MIILGGCGDNTGNINNGSGNAAVVSPDAFAPPDTEVARVDGDVVSFQRLYEHMHIAAEGRPFDRFTQDEFEELKASTLESIITNIIIRDYMAGLPPESKTREVVELFDQLEERFEGSIILQRPLRVGLVSQEVFDEHFEFLKMSNWFLIYVRDETEITEDAIWEYYEANREFMFREVALTSHIMVASYEDAIDILGRLEAGEVFETLARNYSLDYTSRHMGGMIHEFARGQVWPEYEEVAFSLEPGEISDPVRTIMGYHIIRLDDRYRQEPHEGAIRRIVTDILVRTAANERLRELREASSIEVFEVF